MKLNYHLLSIVGLCTLLLFCIWVNYSGFNNAITEGMGSPGGNKKYTYYPGGTASDIKRTIRLSDLKHETYEAAEFF